MAEAEQSNPVPALDNEPLIRQPSGVEARVAALIAPVAAAHGFRLVRVRLLGLNGLTLQIMAERPDGSMTIEDCEFLSQNISPLLDVENVIDRAYNLEVSSPGMDRPLVRKSDFRAWAGHLAKIETDILLDGRKKFRGEIKAATEDGVLFAHTARDGAAQETLIPYEAIAEANLVLTDALIRDALSRDKMEKAAAAAGQEENLPS